MKIRYIKDDGSGRVEDVNDAVGQRLIDSGAAEQVDDDKPVTTDDTQPATPRKSAKKTTRRSK